jgi:prepilin-type N-terminal cleavage/methylation domain-containing protein
MMNNQKGMSFVELMVALVVFLLVMAGILSVYIALTGHSAREYRIAESVMEREIAKNIIERDIMMAGYGLADDYGELDLDPRPVEAVDADSDDPSDSLILRGTAIGILSKSAQGWSYLISKNPALFQKWGDDRENVSKDDRVIYMEPASREVLTSGGSAIFRYPATPVTCDRGALVYGLNSDDAKLPYYTVEITLGGDPPSSCAKGSLNLLRAESVNNDPPAPANRKPVMNCVRDFQVAFGLDTNEDGNIDTWDPVGGVFISEAYDGKTLRKRVKQIRGYILVQSGSYDPDYTYYNPEQTGEPDAIYVGDKNIHTGRDITLTPAQRKYHWEVFSLNITPRNLR